MNQKYIINYVYSQQLSYLMEFIRRKLSLYASLHFQICGILTIYF